MTREQLERAKQIQRDLRRLDKVLCFTDPNKYVTLSPATDYAEALRLLCLNNESSICHILLEYKRKLEKELEEL